MQCSKCIDYLLGFRRLQHLLFVGEALHGVGRGMVNLGNTCFVNAVTQVFASLCDQTPCKFFSFSKTFLDFFAFLSLIIII